MVTNIPICFDALNNDYSEDLKIFWKIMGQNLIQKKYKYKKLISVMTSQNYQKLTVKNKKKFNKKNNIFNIFIKIKLIQNKIALKI